MWGWWRTLWGTNDGSAANGAAATDLKPIERGTPVSANRREYDWSFCHEVDPHREPHKVRLEFLELIDSNQASTWIRSLYRCGVCGQRYLYAYNEISDWTSHGDRDIEAHKWFPITREELDYIRTTRDDNVSDRPFLSMEF